MRRSVFTRLVELFHPRIEREMMTTPLRVLSRSHSSDMPAHVPELARRIRRHALRMTSRGGSSHIGAAVRMADILAVLSVGILRPEPVYPTWAVRCRRSASKRRAGAGG